jgi:hypothetical protein
MKAEIIIHSTDTMYLQAHCYQMDHPSNTGNLQKG